MKDYYATLGVNRDASAEEIKKAFRTLAHQYHPDKATGDEAKFKEINEAYQVLSDTEKRQKYDQFGSAAFDGSAGFGGGAQGFSGFENMDFGDMFGDLFSSFGGTQRGTKEARGNDIEVAVTLSFHDAVFGADQDLTLQKQHRCKRCDGLGAEPGTKMKTCGACKGSGSRVTVQQTILGAMQTRRTCDVCRGRGEAPEQTCTTCRGVGVERGTKTITVHVPSGVSQGDVVRVHGEGEAAPHRGRSGDLYVHIRVRPDERFTRDGTTIQSKARIGFTEAALGCEVSVSTVDGGSAEVRVPAGTQSGTVFRLKGKGVPKGHSRGDHLVTVQVVTPTKLSKQQKKLLEELDLKG